MKLMHFKLILVFFSSGKNLMSVDILSTNPIKGEKNEQVCQLIDYVELQFNLVWSIWPVTNKHLAGIAKR